MRNFVMVCFAALLVAVAGAPVQGQEGNGYLKLHVNPGRAGVFIDGEYVGPASNFRVGRLYTVAAGEHEVRLSDPRYEDVVTKVTIRPGKTTKLRQNLKPLPPAVPPFGRLRVEGTEKFAAVFVNDKFMGHADEFSHVGQGLLLNPGEYKVNIVPVGGGRGHVETVEIEADKVVVVRLQER